MPRANPGPRLRLFGPDDRFGAKRRGGFADYVWYIVWTESGVRRERSTGAGKDDRRKAEEELARFLDARAPRVVGPRHPHEILIADVLDLYGTEHAPNATDAARIGHAIAALLPWWGERTASTITLETCRAYFRHRSAQLAKKEAEQAERRAARATAKARRLHPKAPEAKRDRTRSELSAPSDFDRAGRVCHHNTVRRELGALQAALGYCHAAGVLLNPPVVSLPSKPEARQDWLDRDELARLLRAARREPKARGHLPYIILISYYTAHRREAVLALQWHPNTEGGHVDLRRGLIDFNPIGRPRTRKRRQAAMPIPPRLLPRLLHLRRTTRRFVIEAERPEVVDGEVRMVRGRVRSYKRSLATAVRAAGLTGKRITPHVFKHTGITHLMQDGVDPWAVSGFTATSIETIQKVYGHQHPDYLREAAAAPRGKGRSRR
jgi:site-specific recombinase XerC